MDWYINKLNQDLLWNTIHRVPSVSLIPLSIRETIFKNIIEYYYGLIPHHQTLNLSQKTEINRNTISAFLAKIQNQNTPSFINVRNTNSAIITNPVPNQMFESKQDKSQREFTERQQMYDEMTSKPDIPSPDIFREKTDPADDTIHNMDDLIKQYQIEREKDMQLLSPINGSIIPSGDTIINPSRPKVSFKNDAVIIPSFVVLEETVLQNIEELNSPITETKSREDKHVLQEIRQQLTQFMEIIQDILSNPISSNHSSVSSSQETSSVSSSQETSSVSILQETSSVSILQEKIYLIQSSIDEYLREKT
jgi:hypothetical protein